MIKLTPTQLEDLKAYAADHEIGVHTGYSGRFMYGEKCLGITGGPRELMIFALVILPLITDDWQHGDSDNIPDVPEEWLTLRWDNMGMDMIFYWPDIEAEGK